MGDELRPVTEESRFLALGDSYTCGEGVDRGERWPDRLVALLRDDGCMVADPEIVARTGWTTDELTRGIAEARPHGTFHLVSLLVGVNDQYRGRATEAYAPGFRELLAYAVGRAGGDPHRVIVLSIPDWGVTPFAADRDRGRIAREIDAFNRINAEAAAEAGAHHVDVTEASRQAGADLLVADGLHPSPEAYEVWATLVLPAARRALAGLPPLGATLEASPAPADTPELG
jgi:lysophospholipase L1-like esterase